jgi:anti-sigma B factor antagonist
MTMKSPALKLMEEVIDDVTVLDAHGRLDSTTAKEFGDRMIALIQTGRSAIVVDLKNIAYISSAGFRALLIANRATAAKQGKFALCGVIGEVKRLFEIGSLTEMFLICQTRSDGIARLRGLASGPQRPELLIAEA